MTPGSVKDTVIREVPVLPSSATVAEAARAILDSGLPAIVAVGKDGTFAGIFGEREFFTALFPAYVGELKYAGFLRSELDDVIDLRSCAGDAIARHLNTEHVDIPHDASDTHVVETFLHHRVLLLPITNRGRVVGGLTRADFFAALARRLLDRA